MRHRFQVLGRIYPANNRLGLELSNDSMNFLSRTSIILNSVRIESSIAIALPHIGSTVKYYNSTLQRTN